MAGELLGPSPPDPDWFPLWRPAPAARARLLCLPCAGGGATMYRELAEHLDGVEVLAAQLPGREHRVRQVPLRDLDTLVGQLRQAIDALPATDPERPLFVFGHSLGALLGFALCRRMAGAPGAPRALCVAAARAPHRPPVRVLYDLPLATLLDEVVRLGGTQPRVVTEPELVELLEPALRADLYLAEAHVLAQEPRLSIPIAVLGGVDDHHIPAPTLEPWREVAAAGCAIELLPGGHFFVRDRPAEVAERLRGWIEDALR